MSETALTMEKLMAEKLMAEKVCLRCGGQTLLAARLEQPLAFCVDQPDHHGRVHLSLRTLLCRDCGHVEFWVPDAAQLAGGRELEPVTIQEEDF